jgi:hypothetical protein
MNNDGFEEIAVGSSDGGGTYLYYGASTLSGTPDATFTDESSGDASGYSLTLEDADGDGYGDLLIGAPYEGTTYAGAAYLWLGSGI